MEVDVVNPVPKYPAFIFSSTRQLYPTAELSSETRDTGQK